MKHARFLTLVALLAAPAGAGSMGSTQKGPLQLTLRLYSNKVKPGRTLWYIVDLKNVGKNALLVDARSFSLEILDPNGNALEAPAGEDSSPEEFWLGPGLSTATVAWPDRSSGRKPIRHKDDEIPRDTGYTAIWTYAFLTPGKYYVRAVCDHALVTIQTPYAEFEVFE